MNTRKVSYIYSSEYLQVCDKHPKTLKRASIVHSLIESYKLLNDVKIVNPVPASSSELQSFHTYNYIECLMNLQKKLIKDIKSNHNVDDYLDLDEYEEEFEISSHGLGYDCALFPQIFDYARFVSGATLTAVKELVQEKVDVAVNFNGGWHHGHADEAAGFCYVNDIVIGILKLLKTFQRVLYVDLDIHHGDGVEEAFEHSSKVFTFSLHKCAAGFFPGTGSSSHCGVGLGKNYCLNVPLNDGTSDESFYSVFSKTFDKVMMVYNPQVIVVQCGADSLALDPMGTFNLTSKVFCQCVADILSTKRPLLILGGGGYNIPNTSRCWTQILGTLLDKELCLDIPEHYHFQHYGPDYSLNITKSNRKDENTGLYIREVIETSILKIKKIDETLLTDQELKVNCNYDDNIASFKSEKLNNHEITVDSKTTIEKENCNLKTASLKRTLGDESSDILEQFKRPVFTECNDEK